MPDPTYLYTPSNRFDPVTVCEMCGVQVEDQDVHTAWHRHLLEMIRFAATGRAST